MDKNKNGNNPAFPTSSGERGMTKKEHMATQIMAVLLLNATSMDKDFKSDKLFSDASYLATKGAEALLNSLED